MSSEIVELLGLVPHPEGGWYGESYRSDELIPAQVLPARYNGDRVFSTQIYYLLADGAVSRLHRLGSDEIFHHYLGDPLQVLVITDDGSVQAPVLGVDLAAGERPQLTIPRNSWFGARSLPPTGTTLIGCSVAPGFDFADFEVAPAALRTELASRRDDLAELIEALIPTEDTI